MNTLLELSIACKYLVPRWRQLSVSIISLISILVIALVVWLIVVFFSVKDGLEASWIDKIISLTAPVRITPTDHYYHSYYYLVDSISSQSNYAPKTIKEKLESETNPYDPNYDEEPPSHWSIPDKDSNGLLKDPVKKAFQIISSMPDLQASDYEMTVGILHLRLLRKFSLVPLTPKQNFLEKNAYIGTFDPHTFSLAKALIPLTSADLTNLIHMVGVSAENIKEEQPERVIPLPLSIFRQRMNELMERATIKTLKTSLEGWNLPPSLYPSHAELKGYALFKKEHLIKIVLPNKFQNKFQTDEYEVQPVRIKFDEGKVAVKYEKEGWNPLSLTVPLTVEQGLTLNASKQEIDDVQGPSFKVNFILQGIAFQGNTHLNSLEVDQVIFNQPQQQSPFWLTKSLDANGKPTLTLPVDAQVGEGILLPRSFREAGALVGDQGYLSYYAATTSTIQEQRIPIFVAGFYDPGIMPIGGKYILASHETTSLIRAAYNNPEDGFLTNGINVRFDDLSKANEIKASLLRLFKEEGIAPYWKIETYQEFEFTRDLIQQLHSEKNLFTLISTVIIIVACSNIISMLIILVNDKKHEIGILRSMGASSASIATIFGICGIVMGTIGSLMGIGLAVLTLHYLDYLVHLISRVQGYDLFNPVFYGETLPNQVSYEALLFVVMATAIISLLAGIVPAVKASLIRPSAILRSE